MNGKRARELRKARESFLVDQFTAATAEHAETVARAIAAGDQPLDELHPAVHRLSERFRLWLRAGLIASCDHLDPDAPGRSYWIAGMPKVLRCETCLTGAALAAQESIRRGEPQACDVCRAELREDQARNLMVPVLSTLVLANLCPGCHGASPPDQEKTGR